MKASILYFSILFLFVFNSNFAQDLTDKNKLYPSINNSTSQLFRYYFFPNLEAYYDNKTSDYVYKINGNWIRNKSIPNSYCGYSIYNNYKVEIENYKGDNPFENIVEDKKLYPYYRNDRQGKLAQLKAKQIADSKKCNTLVDND